ncbi:PAS domain-containing protein [Massilia sp. 9I]|uniref:PAS domain-containing protein n=1 Tax=Massilia sp. 9I TaxID=2653152 RepID=UPI0013598F98|nr:PAS domain-containing protein [Massilia sp. 9I]
MQKAARLALIASGDDWAMVSMHLPDGAAPQRICTAERADLGAALEALEAQVSREQCDIPDMRASSLPPSCRDLAQRSGVGSYRAVRRSFMYGSAEGSCVIAVASAAAREAGASIGLELIADLFAAGVPDPSARGIANGDDAMFGFAAPAIDAAPASEARHAQEQFRLLFESAPGPYLVLLPADLRIVAVSNAYLAATMVTREQIVGRRMFDVFPDDPADQAESGVAALNASLQRVLQTRLADVMAVQRYPIRRPDGSFELRYWSPVNSPVLDADGRVMYIIHRVEDVTDYVLAHRPPAPGAQQATTTRLEAEIVLRSYELKRMADSLAQSEQRLRYVTRATNDVIWDWSMVDDVLWCSRSALEPLGSVLARSTTLADWGACIHPDDRERVDASLRASVAAQRENWSAEYRLCLPGDVERHVLHRCFTVIDEQGGPQRMVGTIADLTEQKRQEARVRMQAEMLDYATDAILVRDLDNRVVYWNQAAAARYGWNSDEVIGRPVSETLYARCAPSDFQHAMQVLMRHGDYSGRMVHAAADGRKFVVHVHWILVRREDGTPRAILSVVTDLSEQIALEQRLLQIQKLESLGRLTGGLAHDFNNWLTVILGSAEELMEALDGQPALREVAHMIQMAGERGAELTRRLLAFGRRQPLTPQTFDVGEAIASIRPLIVRSLPENIDLQLVDMDHRWCVYADRSQLEAAIINLCINARDAMPDGGKLTIQLLLADVEEQGAGLSKPLPSGEYVVIAVADNGAGISQDVMEHVFEPFFTTKDEASGSGLGLSMVYGFVRQSNGDVTIYSELGRGTQLKLYLPRAHAEPVARPQPAAAAGRRPPPGRAVLLVEDDPIVRAHIRGLLRELQCEVMEASGAEEALAQLAAGAAVDLLFTDVVMPGMAGTELATRARAMRPGLSVLLSSGYTFEAMRHQDEPAPGIRFLNKPYGKSVLAQTLAEALGTGGETR